MLADLFSSTDATGGHDDDDENMKRVSEMMTSELPLRAVVSFSADPRFTREYMKSMIDKLNETLGEE